ncbi:pirin family protein [Rubrimonas cliftonensis]|uniref:Quercetin 2,3-dioxygenase n=1 Tax=Rubrimonas cliftonensis TaxID=89524 RepID=A0A1H4GHE4_9RHOB|nr:pirin family protein [Rubrimonas cliftonensis]SEB09043.1 hypothetical protein SAMN05444370_1762 [Rubrimonas cliftonensis]
MTKTILGRFGGHPRHWVGDGFPVRTLFSHAEHGAQVSPFLLLDYAGPHVFEPSETRRGVGLHPHRGFETVTIVHEGAVEHRDSAGHGGLVGPGDVQWMTAGDGVLHEEFHSEGFARTGGPFRMVQLWINLPAAQKRMPPAYQALGREQIPSVAFEGAAARVVAGDLGGVRGPARTVTPVNVWDVRLAAGADVKLPAPEGHTTLLAVLSGHVTVDGAQDAREAEVVLLGREGRDVALHAGGETRLLVLTGEPIDEPIVGQGPFVMNNEAEIREAVEDFRRGRFGAVSA